MQIHVFVEEPVIHLLTHSSMLYWPSENKMAAHPFLRVGWASLRIHSVFLTISDSTFKVFIVKKQIRMCNYSIFYGNYFDIHFQYRQKVYIYRKKSIWRYFINDNTGNIGRLKYREKTINTKIPTELRKQSESAVFSSYLSKISG